MRIAHLADLHLGKTVNGFSMIEDQKYILDQILLSLKEEKVNAVMLSGDIYDRSIPSAEATVLLDWFLSSLQKDGYEVFMIAGNHDSSDRLEYAAGLLTHMNIHIVGNYDGKISCFDMKDAYGTIHFYLLPYMRPYNVNRYIEDENEHVTSYEEALKKAIESVDINTEDRNVILSHQFVTGALYDAEHGSEEISLGGTDAVSGNLYDEFDYVALGHIHRPQRLLRDTMRYAGTPLKYSFSEAAQTKTMPIIDMHEKGNIAIRFIELKPLHELREIHGLFTDLIRNRPKDDSANDYVHITLNDEEDVPDAVKQLRTAYPNLMRLDYDNTRTRTSSEVTVLEEMDKKSPLEIFSAFYEERNGQEMKAEQKKIITDLIEEIWNEGGQQ